MLRDPVDDVALGDYSEDLTFLVDHRGGPDPILGKHLGDRRDGLVRRDGDDMMTFVLQDCRNPRFHVSISWLLISRPEGSVLVPVSRSNHYKTDTTLRASKAKRQTGRYWPNLSVEGHPRDRTPRQTLAERHHGAALDSHWSVRSRAR